MKEIISIFKKEKIQTISSTTFTPELSLSKGNFTRNKPNFIDKIDIRNAMKALNKSNQYSHIQGAVSRNNSIILEKKEGTQKMLKKCKSKKFSNQGVLVKLPKKKQDFRIDLPTVGLQTFKQCKSAGLKGIVLKSKLNVFLERKKCINFANKNKMFVSVK